MNGDTLALGAVAALALIGAAKRGSAARVVLVTSQGQATPGLRRLFERHGDPDDLARDLDQYRRTWNRAGRSVDLIRVAERKVLSGLDQPREPRGLLHGRTWTPETDNPDSVDEWYLGQGHVLETTPLGERTIGTRRFRGTLWGSALFVRATFAAGPDGLEHLVHTLLTHLPRFNNPRRSIRARGEAPSFPKITPSDWTSGSLNGFEGTGSVPSTVAKVKAALSDDLRQPGQRSGCPTCGHCYVASEALYHLLGGAESGYRPHVGSDRRGTHWWLVARDGTVVDPTADQWPTGYDYDKGRGAAFLTKEPSKRAKVVMQRVRKGSRSRSRQGEFSKTLDLTTDRPLRLREARKLKRAWEGAGWSAELYRVRPGWFGVTATQIGSSRNPTRGSATFTAADAAQAGAYWQGANDPIDVTAAELDWRVESAYPREAVVGLMPSRDWAGWLAAEGQHRSDRDTEEGSWLARFTRWWTTHPDEPIVLVEDQHGRPEGIWDGWHRTAVSLVHGTRLPAFVGRRRSRGSLNVVEPQEGVTYLILLTRREAYGNPLQHAAAHDLTRAVRIVVEDVYPHGTVYVHEVKGHRMRLPWHLWSEMWAERVLPDPPPERWAKAKVLNYSRDLREWHPPRRSIRGTRNVVTEAGYHRTAIDGSGPSAPLRHLLSHHSDWVQGRVLDFGTGKGRDCKALGKHGAKVACYDPHHPDAQIRREPSGTFDLVLATYVVNVLPKKERTAAVKKMAAKVKRGGRLVVSARGCGDRSGVQASKGWKKHGDGRAQFAPDGQLKRFQRFFGRDTLAAELRSVLGRGFSEVDVTSPSSSIALVAFQRS